MTYVKNSEQLLTHGSRGLREKALAIIEHALAAASPYKACRNLVRIKGDVLQVNDLNLDLSHGPKIYIIGAGKASFPIAKALEELLGDRITAGLVICKYGQKGQLHQSRMVLASHPIPDEAGMEGAHQTLELARQTRSGDIVLCCYTGGSSALLPYPVEGVSLDEKKVLNQLLLYCGANIIEINAVRKHLSSIKGGRLAADIHPKAHLINLTVSDVIGDPLDYITDPTVADTSTLDDARATLSKYDLWSRVPASVSHYLKTAGPDQETPKEKDLVHKTCFNLILVAGDAACVAAAEKARMLGFEAVILSTMLEGESAELGHTFGAIAREVLLNKRPLEPPCAIIGGGETTVKITSGFGLGGPNQEFALAAAQKIAGLDQVLIAGIDSDGTDGPTDFAGGLVDGSTLERAQSAKIDVNKSLEHHNATQALQELEDIVETGATGTNVNDLKILLVDTQERKNK
jgi:glycerate-2-kinase